MPTAKTRNKVTIPHPPATSATLPTSVAVSLAADENTATGPPAATGLADTVIAIPKGKAKMIPALNMA